MVWCPDELKKVAERIGETPPPRATVRKLLSWFNAERRGVNVVGYVNAALRTLEIQTVPSFEDAWIDAEVEFRRAGAVGAASEPAQPAQPVSAEQGAPTAPIPLASAAGAGTAQSSTEVAALPPLTLISRTDRDPVHRIGKLDAANREPECIAPDAELREAVTLMLLRDFSQLPVMNGKYNCRGMVSWRSIGKRAVLGSFPQYVRDCMEPAEVVSADDNVFKVVPLVMSNGYVLVTSAERQLQGIVTATDLAGQFGTLLEPFLLIGEIEAHIRLLLDERLPLATIQGARDPADGNRAVNSAADLTFGEYRRLLERPPVWVQLGIPLHKGRVLAELEPVRDIRNDVMHFTPEGIGAGKLSSLRDFAAFLREVARPR